MSIATTKNMRFSRVDGSRAGEHSKSSYRTAFTSMRLIGFILTRNSNTQVGVKSVLEYQRPSSTLTRKWKHSSRDSQWLLRCHGRQTVSRRGQKICMPLLYGICLLGLFGISMPLLYGKGSKAFVRLQEEIMKSSHDTSILAWGLRPQMGPTMEPLLQDLAAFKDCSKFRAPLLADSPEQF